MARRFAAIGKGNDVVIDETETTGSSTSHEINDNEDDISTIESHQRKQNGYRGKFETLQSDQPEDFNTADEYTDAEEKSPPVSPSVSSEARDIRIDNENTPITFLVHDDSINIAKLKVPKDIFKKAKVLSLSQGKEIYISYWDLGGDELYYATHHIHMSPDAVYLLVFDVSEMMKEDTRQEQLG